jgi:hypothetical protein
MSERPSRSTDQAMTNIKTLPSLCCRLQQSFKTRAILSTFRAADTSVLKLRYDLPPAP